MRNKRIKYQDDTKIVYKCGCSESRLEYPEYWQKLCKKHSVTPGGKDGKR
jgi:hypothetical protein